LAAEGSPTIVSDILKIVFDLAVFCIVFLNDLINCLFLRGLVGGDHLVEIQVWVAHMRQLSHFDYIVRWILIFLHLTTQVILQIRANILNWPLINLIAFLKKEEVVEAIEEFGRGLMDGADDGHIINCGFISQYFYNSQSSFRIQPTRRLITQQQLWICNELIANASPLPFSA